MEVKLENGLEAKQDLKNKGEVMSEEAKRFMGQISKQLALVFNKLIFSMNCQRKELQKSQPEPGKKKKK